MGKVRRLHTAGVTSSKLVLPTKNPKLNQALRGNSRCFFFSSKQYGPGLLLLIDFSMSFHRFRNSQTRPIQSVLSDASMVSMRPCFLPLCRRSQRFAQLEKNAMFVLKRVQLLSPANPRKNALQGFFDARTGAVLKRALPCAYFARQHSLKADCCHLVSKRQ